MIGSHSQMRFRFGIAFGSYGFFHDLLVDHGSFINNFFRNEEISKLSIVKEVTVFYIKLTQVFKLLVD